MNRNQAGSLATLIAQSWPRSAVAVDVWEEELAELDHARAEEAYRCMRRELKHAPAIADLLERYHRLAGSAPKADRTEPDCYSCHDSGWVTCTDHPNHRGHFRGREDRRPTGDECSCNIVRPCACATGKAAHAAHYGPRGHA